MPRHVAVDMADVAAVEAAAGQGENGQTAESAYADNAGASPVAGPHSCVHEDAQCAYATPTLDAGKLPTPPPNHPARVSTPSPTAPIKRPGLAGQGNGETGCDVGTEALPPAPLGKRQGDASASSATALLALPPPAKRLKRARSDACDHASSAQRPQAVLSIADLPRNILVEILGRVPEADVASALCACKLFGGPAAPPRRQRRSLRIQRDHEPPVLGLADAVWQAKCVRLERQAHATNAAAAAQPPPELAPFVDEGAAARMRHLYSPAPASTAAASDGDGDAPAALPPRSFWHYLRHRLHWHVMARRVGRHRLTAPPPPATPPEAAAPIAFASVGGDARKLTYLERAEVVGWLLEVGDEFEIPARTMHLAVSYIDRALGCAQLGRLQAAGGSGCKKQLVHRNNLQLLGAACLALAWAHHRGCVAVEPGAVAHNPADQQHQAHPENGGGDAAAAANDGNGNGNGNAGNGNNGTARTENNGVAKVPPFGFFVELSDHAFSEKDLALTCGMLLFHVLDDERALAEEVLVGPGRAFTRERWAALSRATLPTRVLGHVDTRAPAGFALQEEALRRADTFMVHGDNVSTEAAALVAATLEHHHHHHSHHGGAATATRLAPSTEELRKLLCRLKDAHLEQPSRDWLPVFLAASEWFTGAHEEVTHYAKYLLELALVSPLGLKHAHADLAAAAAWLARFTHRMRYEPMPALDSFPNATELAEAYAALERCHESMPARLGCAVDQIKAAMMPPETHPDGTTPIPQLLTQGFAGAQCVAPNAVAAAIRTLVAIAYDPLGVAGMLGSRRASHSASPARACDAAARATASEVVQRVSGKYMRESFREVAHWTSPKALPVLLACIGQHSAPVPV